MQSRKTALLGQLRAGLSRRYGRSAEIIGNNVEPSRAPRVSSADLPGRRWQQSARFERGRTIRMRHPHTTKTLSALAFALCCAAVLPACRVDDKDVARWAQTEHGPDKLVAVVTHDKYDWKLRGDAAAALVGMKPRQGRRVGIPLLTDADATLAPEDRKKLGASLVPMLTSEMDKPPPQQQGLPADAASNDPSVPYKDAAFALLTYDKAVLIADDDQRKQLQDALIRWTLADFDRRIAITQQLYGLEQILRQFGADGVRGVPPLITPDSSYDKMIALVAELGDQASKDAASKKLVDVGVYTESKAWFDKRKPQVADANKAAGYNVDDAKLTKQVQDYQEEQIIKVFASLKKIGQRPAVEYLFGVAGDKTKPEKRRQAALAALEGRLDRNNANDIARTLAIAGADDTPDAVRELALQRISELPREAVAAKLYDLFNAKKWKIRWVAASTLLKMSAAKDVPDFYNHLPQGAAPGFAISEPLTYGGLIAGMKPPLAKDAMVASLKSPRLTEKLTALGYFYSVGKAADDAIVAPFLDDKTPVPKTDDKEDPDAKWQCTVAKAGAPSGDPIPVLTVGDFVKNCVQPAMDARKLVCWPA